MAKATTTTNTTNTTNIYRVRTGWYLQLQWVGRVYRELFSDSRYEGRDGALAAAIQARDWYNKFRPECEAGVRACLAAIEAQDEQAHTKACRAWATAIGKRLGPDPVDRELYDQYYAQEPGYVPATTAE